MLFSDDEFEEPVDVFYQRWSKLADHMLADPDLNMYICVIQYPFVGGARLREAPDLIPKWCGYFPTEKQEMFMRVARRGDIGVFMFDKTAQNLIQLPRRCGSASQAINTHDFSRDKERQAR